MNKKKMLILGSITALALPLSFVVACNNKDDSDNKAVLVEFNNGTITVTFNEKSNTVIDNDIKEKVWESISSKNGNNDLKDFHKLIVTFKLSNKSFYIINENGFSKRGAIFNSAGGNWKEKN